MSNVHSLIDLSTYMDIKTRNNPEIHGALIKEFDAGMLNSLMPLPVTHGQGRVMFAVNAGADITGAITITGTSVNRDNTENETAFDTEDIAIAGLTTDNSSVDVLTAIVHDFQDCYMSTKWWQGELTLSTLNVDLSDIDVYLVNFDQFGDHRNVMVEGLEIEGLKTNVNGAMSAHLYSVLKQTGNKYDIQSIADLVHTAGKIATNRRAKLRKSGINVKFNGTTDGVFLNMQMDRVNQPDWEDITTHIHAIALCGMAN